MSGEQQSKVKSEERGLLARPLDTLVFLLPLMAFYEVASLTYHDRVVAFEMLQVFFALFGHVGILAPGLAVVTILLATHAVSREPWTIHWRGVGRMYGEAAGLAIPLVLLNQVFPLTAGANGQAPLVARLAMGVGAGVYEELVFRLVLISVVVMLGSDLLRLNRRRVAVAAVILSAVVFAAHHHYPFGSEPFGWYPFLFRSVAGVYLAVVFWYRGYGSAAGCHAAYNAALALGIPGWIKSGLLWLT